MNRLDPGTVNFDFLGPLRSLARNQTVVVYPFVLTGFLANYLLEVLEFLTAVVDEFGAFAVDFGDLVVLLGQVGSVVVSFDAVV